jgi:hypothetical protein
MNALPLKANGFNYCIIKPQYPVVDNLFGYWQIIPKKDECADGIYYNTGGILHISFSRSCERQYGHDYQLCSLGTTESPYASLGNVGNVSAYYSTMKEGYIG